MKHVVRAKEERRIAVYDSASRRAPLRKPHRRRWQQRLIDGKEYEGSSRRRATGVQRGLIMRGCVRMMRTWTTITADASGCMHTMVGGVLLKDVCQQRRQRETLEQQDVRQHQRYHSSPHPDSGIGRQNRMGNRCFHSQERLGPCSSTARQPPQESSPLRRSHRRSRCRVSVPRRSVEAPR